MAEEEEKISMFGTSFMGTPERWRARFNTVFEGQKNLRLYKQLNPTDKDFAAFIETHPVEGEKLQRTFDQGRFHAYGTGIGAVGCTLQCLRWTRSVPLIGVSAFISIIASNFIADDIGKWIYGTYKFDTHAINRSLLHYVRDELRTTEPPSFDEAASPAQG